MSAITIPDLCLVALVGASGSGKSTFAARHFGPFETISSDYCRGLVSNDENDQSATADAFDVLGYIAGRRLQRGLLTVVDATNVDRHARAAVIALAREHDVPCIAIVLDVEVATAVERNAARPDRTFGAKVVKRHADQLRRSLRGLRKEGFAGVHVLREPDIEAAEIVREPLRTNRSDLRGPFDAVGDIHGCLPELVSLLTDLGYVVERDEHGRPVDASHPEGRTAILLGDLVDRGPDSPGVLRLAMGMAAAGHALVVPGNHENKLIKALRGRHVQTSHGLAETLAQLEAEPEEFRTQVLGWLDGLPSHLVLDGGALVVAHAGLVEKYHGRASGRVRSFALYGDTTGETDEFGLPVRYPWARDYRGRAMVLYGHTPTPEPVWENNTMCLDTGAVFGGRLTALRYPERELVSVPAERVYYEPVKPFGPAAARPDDDLVLGDVLGKRVIDTGVMGRVTIGAEQSAGALEVMSRFAMHPRWVPYLPPTMAPVTTSTQQGVLEHPDQAFDAYAGVPVICEEKHMGSRGVLLVCRDAEVAQRRFGADAVERTGAVYTRTGRAFFDTHLTESLLAKVRGAVDQAGLWDELGTDWLLLDAEVLPWSAKAEGLLQERYAPVGAAARVALPVAVDVLEQAAARGQDVEELLARTRQRAVGAEAFTAAYRRYQWPTEGLDGVQVAPFQLLASEGRTWFETDHAWHLALADRLVAADGETFRTTRRIAVDPDSASSREQGVQWWTDLVEAGGEGMVVKPMANLVRGRRGLLQPGLKVRGPEYLRLIYGPDYPMHLDRLRDRSLGRKRQLALREYALGLESLTRLAAGEPLWRVHEPVFGVLALESDPVDPRL
ncbi:polynucleotide kinase-phosphatase [Pseudactinotalea sp.]|uniref:polynucleotide kinase-phosphatase n=1 Tax=Pseudactinotalea sp. TaxID=1926260 RepID=UPI003B3B9BFE